MVFSSQFHKNVSHQQYIEDVKQQGEIELDEFSEQLFCLTSEHLSEIDHLIEQSLKGWELLRIPKVSLAVLRISVAQLCYMKDIGDSVVINEAVEISKKFSGDDDYVFVNGSLRTLNDLINNEQQ